MRNDGGRLGGWWWRCLPGSAQPSIHTHAPVRHVQDFHCRRSVPAQHQRRPLDHLQQQGLRRDPVPRRAPRRRGGHPRLRRQRLHGAVRRHRPLGGRPRAPCRPVHRRAHRRLEEEDQGRRRRRRRLQRLHAPARRPRSPHPRHRRLLCPQQVGAVSLSSSISF